jgi:hypothetical protein
MSRSLDRQNGDRCLIPRLISVSIPEALLGLEHNVCLAGEELCRAMWSRSSRCAWLTRQFLTPGRLPRLLPFQARLPPA